MFSLTVNIKKEIIDIFGDISITINSIINSLSFDLGDLGVKIRPVEDEWFIVSISYIIKIHGSKLRNAVVFQCDQESGLLALLKDLKSLIDKYNI